MKKVKKQTKNQLEKKEIQNQQEQIQEKNKQKIQNQKDEIKKNNFRALKIGIIANGINDEDILYYNQQLRLINEVYKEKIRIIVLGYKEENDRLNMLQGVIFEYVKPVSIIHYFKQLAMMKIDLLFIPLINNKYNATSENYNKYLEASLFKIPLIAPDIYPYNKVIINEVNGFIFGQRENFIPYLKNLLSKKINLIKICGENAQNDVFKNFNYSKQNIEYLSSIFI
jgi:hypothetical protein